MRLIENQCSYSANMGHARASEKKPVRPPPPTCGTAHTVPSAATRGVSGTHDVCT